MAARRLVRRLLTSAISIYIAMCLIGAVLLAGIALNPPRRPLDPEITIRRISQQFPGSEREDASVAASDGAQLRGWFLHPQNYNGNVVIILHGVADNRRSSAGFAGDFLPSGYAVLLPDSRAHGESGGAHATFGVKEKDDIRQWINWLELKAEPHCVYLLGESMGAAIAIQATAADPRICATVAESPFATFREVAYERIGQMTHTGPWFAKTVARPLIELAFVAARLRSGVWLTEASPLSAIRKTHTPILLIHGAADTNISPSESKQLFNAARDHAQLWIVPGAGHCGASAVRPEEFRRRVVGWFEMHPAAAK